MLPHTTSTLHLAPLPGMSWASVPIMAEPISRSPGQTRSDRVPKCSNVKCVGDATLTSRVSLPENTPSQAVGVDCGVRFLNTHPATKLVVDPISHGGYFDDPVFLRDLTFTLAGGIERNVVPAQLLAPTLGLAGE